MSPAPGERLQRFVGDVVRFGVRAPIPLPSGWRAFLRTNLGRAEALRLEMIRAHAQALPPAGEAWRDIPMPPAAGGWQLDLPLAEVGYYCAKAYLLDPRGFQHWPDGPDLGISVHPDQYRTGNTIYCAFVRLFGPTRDLPGGQSGQLEATLAQLEGAGYAVLPPSGKLRDLTAQLPHIVGDLGCRILHLLPIHPTPTTYARFGRFGSPYAALDLNAIDPALVEFDRKTTAFHQFRELTFEAHRLGARVFLDIVINHTGWGSTLHDQHPEWFLRNEDGTFASPGAWGTTWEDLVELKHNQVALWDTLADMLVGWCAHGVDGFRCDAGYKVPVTAWQYIVARVRQEYPETLFLLEGLGGAWAATEALLTDGGMQWAYSELFQNYSPSEVAHYLDHSFRQSDRVGLLVHYSETHDNARLAAKGRAWSLLRNRLCGLASVSGGFGFTCGVEWLAQEKIKVHGSTGLNWGHSPNLVAELSNLNRLLAGHPCFFDGASVRRLSAPDSPVLALRREAPAATATEGNVRDNLLVLANLDPEQPREWLLDAAVYEALGKPGTDLLTGNTFAVEPSERRIRFQLKPAAVVCLADSLEPRGLVGDAYRQRRAASAWAVHAANQVLAPETLAGADPGMLGELAVANPVDYLGALSALAADRAPNAALTSLRELQARRVEVLAYNPVLTWSVADTRRIMPVPAGHWVLIENDAPFRASVESAAASRLNLQSLRINGRHIAALPPREIAGRAQLVLECYGESGSHVEASLDFLGPEPAAPSVALPRAEDVVLLTNGRGGMARLCVDLGRIQSKYDCVLGANLHPQLPVDRHILAKRIRVWVNADGFISALDYRNLKTLDAGPPARWGFVASAGDGRTVEIEVTAEMLAGRNATVFHFHRPGIATARGKQLPDSADVRLTVRLDIEDRGFHGETKRNGGADHHFGTHTRPVGRGSLPCPGPLPLVAGTGGTAPAPAPSDYGGFAFTPAPDRGLLVYVSSGLYHPEPEWSHNIPHPVEQTRGQEGAGDAYSPGWFELPLPKGARIQLVVTAEPEPAAPGEEKPACAQIPAEATADFGARLAKASRVFLVERAEGKTVIAGYPWFLDWGRDTFICARGLLAAGLAEEVRQIALVFARFERQGTLPNTIFGEDASNRDTSDAPLWFALVCEELAALDPAVYDAVPPGSDRPLREVLSSIAGHYVRGTPNGIRMDPASGLIWSPSHFTWMDTNHPAATPREGYPVEIQALWIRLLRQMVRMEPRGATDWRGLEERALRSLESFWLPGQGWFSDVLKAGPGQSARDAVPDDALRSNGLFLVSLGLVGGPQARLCVDAARRHLVVPGALRSLAPLPVAVPLPIHGQGGQLLNDPKAPYWGRYEGDEDTRRKPAYHNGTAWTWTFPAFCESLARAWDFEPLAVAAARSFLGSMEPLLGAGCLGQVPEILDGDAPHTQRGCDAQAWGATEAFRVWKLLQTPPRPGAAPA